MQKNVTCDTMGDLDGGLARAVINKALSTAIADLDDRGDDGKPRTVTITVTMARMDNGLIVTDIQASTKTPAYRTSATVSKLKSGPEGARLLFQQFSPNDPNQRTIDEVAENTTENPKEE